ncbi:hypothetical protein SAMN00768000_3741 [Sulfobacillus thermosulfidooxidans DSM 9293]|uniref:Uncharacterized protein n=1 Tax=Sulfobacillus thermosulfidooxidans (strain DSM 9293 / VKM B-1269 / AT-1) TaxID=929705 RepID=A0A1W1WPR9_SULTA|nr:hypothetical protein [Sulfobacillus thermosulfidooxidans]SMC08202.1 hypothetical protein SAMN00768000_3741 [Sulfobacillus thermosulfidooxidans DSM 9293]
MASFDLETQLDSWRLITTWDAATHRIQTELWPTVRHPDASPDDFAPWTTQLAGSAPVWQQTQPATPTAFLAAGTQHFHMAQALQRDPLPPLGSDPAEREALRTYCDTLWQHPAPEAPLPEGDDAVLPPLRLFSQPDPDRACVLETIWQPGHDQARMTLWRTDTLPPVSLYDAEVPSSVAGAEHAAVMDVLADHIGQTPVTAWADLVDQARLYRTADRPTIPTDQAYLSYDEIALSSWGPYTLTIAQPVDQPVQMTLARTDKPPDEAVVWFSCPAVDHPEWPTTAADLRFFAGAWKTALDQASRQYVLPTAADDTDRLLARVTDRFFAKALDATATGPLKDSWRDTLADFLPPRHLKTIRDFPAQKMRLLVEPPDDPDGPWMATLTKAKRETTVDDSGQRVTRWRTVDKFAPLWRQAIAPDQVDAFVHRVDAAIAQFGQHPAWFPPTWPEVHPQRLVSLVQAAAQGPVVPEGPATPQWHYGFDPDQGVYFLWKTETADPTSRLRGVATGELATPIPGMEKLLMPMWWADPFDVLNAAAEKGVYPQPASRVPQAVIDRDRQAQAALHAAVHTWEQATQPAPAPQRVP